MTVVSLWLHRANNKGKEYSVDYVSGGTLEFRRMYKILTADMYKQFSEFLTTAISQNMN